MTIVHADGSTLKADTSAMSNSRASPALCAAVPLECSNVKRTAGRGEGYDSLFIAAGEPGAIGVRIGGEITGTDAFSAPVEMPRDP